ncbi:purple acid phosphatase family protein [Luteimonas suaedae]|uniref:purple acid phosphatase family protein n=1 Tax=Luteimonas suaedae TaxID=2605430 RepID=UPI0011EBCD8C|nr:metallophosphoesterase family protein [Luteimonas suaedae]
MLLAMSAIAGEAAPRRVAEPNTLVPAGVIRYAPSGFPDRIVASPAQDAATGFAVAWRTGAMVETPWLEIVEAGDSPDMGVPQRIRATTQALTTENGPAHHHRAEVGDLQPDTLYAWRVQGDRTWSPWRQLRTAAAADAPLTLLYFGDTQNKNASLTTRVTLEALRHAPDARLALYAGDLVSGGDGEDDNEWGEWFDAAGPLPSLLMVAPAAGNHEHFEEFEDTPQERRVLGAHWPSTFALPGNGARGAEATSYWFDIQGVRVVVLDGTSALDMGTAQAQAAWLEDVLDGAASRWTIALIHQPMFSPRQDRDNALLREHLLPVLERHRVDLVLQGHDHVYGRRGGPVAGQATPQYVVSVAGAKQYRLSQAARRDMSPTAEDTQLFQVLRIDGDALRYEARTATGRLYDAFSLHRDADGARRIEEHVEGRIGQRDCPRTTSPKGREDRCWE